MVYKSKKSLSDSIRLGSSCRCCMGKKISEKTKGVKKSEEHKLNLSNAKIGTTLSETHKSNIGNAVRGLKRSDESKIKYSISKTGDKNPSKSMDVREKIRNSIIKLYREHPEIKDKISKSIYEYFRQNGDYVNDDEITRYLEYRRVVRNLTRRNKRLLFGEWNGYDYYDNEFILGNLDLEYNNSDYPTIDHRISILYGFKNNLTIDEISSISNLCITKRRLNISKGVTSESDFLEKLSIL